MDLQNVIDKNELHETVMNDTNNVQKEPLIGKTYRDFLRHLKKKERKNVPPHNQRGPRFSGCNVRLHVRLYVSRNGTRHI